MTIHWSNGYLNYPHVIERLRVGGSKRKRKREKEGERETERG
jgi:hypothetical protein